MKIIDEIKISLFNPSLYYKLKQQHLSKILIFNFITAVIGFIFINLKKVIGILFSSGKIKFEDVYKGIGPVNIIASLLYMWVGIILTALILSIIISVFYKIKKDKLLTFGQVFNYISHALMVGSILSPFVGSFTLFFVLIVYYMAVKSERINFKTEE